jgi:hypothetical protein
MELSGLLRLAHALSGVAFIAGLVGFWILLGLARRADSISLMRLYIRASDPFARLVTAGGISVTVLGIATALVLGRPLFGPLQGFRLDWLAVANMLMLPLVGFLAAVYPRFARRLGDALRTAEADGGTEVTPAIATAWADPVYRFARTYELIAVVVVFGLMVAKPF